MKTKNFIDCDALKKEIWDLNFGSTLYMLNCSLHGIPYQWFSWTARINLPLITPFLARKRYYKFAKAVESYKVYLENMEAKASENIGKLLCAKKEASDEINQKIDLTIAQIRKLVQEVRDSYQIQKNAFDNDDTKKIAFGIKLDWSSMQWVNAKI
ncbi:hypothetical protein [Campylobacter sp. JMF_08 NE1]|uniref:hypothetical protein n=1 Tax=Campylobacter sp. JMF_08 NE1 TaxID=2983821 RepID=UPI0022E9C7CB|nr:hypothetical protein [Campylobacter sp. JMF_08 NE1]MDA3047522.1 hypothetical protein [Campylobacter sp. JMF_08 NE1]